MGCPVGLTAPSSSADLYSMARRWFVVLAFVGILGLTGCNPVLSNLQPSPSGTGCDTALVAAETSFAHGSPLNRNPSLDAAAQIHSAVMADTGNLTHDGWDAQIWGAGYAGSTIGQNIAFGYSATDVIGAWMDSAGHRANILNGAFHDVGIGCVNKGGTLWWSQDFGG